MPSKARSHLNNLSLPHRTNPTPPESVLPPSPGPSAAHPWKFRVGEWVHARGMPHYVVRTTAGDVWRLPQIHLSTRAS